MLTVTHGNWTNAATGHTDQWEDCSARGTACQPIAGGTATSYGLTSSDVGHTVVVVETAANATGAGTSVARHRRQR